MTCDFTSLSTVFQSYQDNVRLIMKGCVQRLKRFSPQAGVEPGSMDLKNGVYCLKKRLLLQERIRSFKPLSKKGGKKENVRMISHTP